MKNFITSAKHQHIKKTIKFYLGIMFLLEVVTVDYQMIGTC